MIKNLKYPVRTLIGIVAILLSLIASVVLIYRSAQQGSVWHVISFSIYCLSLLTLWTTSTLYHSLNVSDKANQFLEQLDHAMIYFLIAGTYTPICLVVLRGGWGWSLFGINWALAVTGIILKLTFRKPSKGIVAVLFSFYILMGWLIVIAWFPLTKTLPPQAVFWLFTGGIFYTLGAVIYNIKRLQLTPHFGYHEIWHLFVFLGSSCHYWMMLKYILYFVK